VNQWFARKGRDGVRQYWAEKNVTNVDGISGIGATAQQEYAPLVESRLDVTFTKALAVKPAPR